MKTTKRIISLILAMLFIGGCFAVGASAEGDMKVTATYDSKNNEVTVNISDIPSGYTVEKTGITVETSSTIIKDPNIKGGGDEFIVKELTPGSKYKITVTATKGSDTKTASTEIALKITQDPPINANIEKRSTTSITVNSINGAEYGIVESGASADTVKYQDSNVLTPENPKEDIYYDIYVRFKETDTKYASTAKKMQAKLMKSGGESAVAVKVVNVTETEITLKAVEGYEYSKDYGENFQKDPVFKGLQKGKEYFICQRKIASADTEENKTSSCVTVVTNTAPAYNPNINKMKEPEFEKESRIYVGEDNVIYAYASDRRVTGDPQWGDLAYVPARYEVYKGGVKESEGTFTLENNATGQYKATFKPAVKASDYSIKVLYAKERWEGVGVQYITVDTDTVRTLKFTAKPKPPKWVEYITTAITFFLSTIPKLIQKILPAFKFLMDNIRKNA